MQRSILSIVALAALSLPAASFAGDFSYTNVDVTFASIDFDRDLGNLSGDGLGLRGSLAFSPNFFAFAQYQEFNMNHGIDGNDFRVGVGGHWPINPTLDVVGKVGYIDQGKDFDDNGFMLGASLRGRINEKFEAEGGLEYADMDNRDSTTTLVLEGRYNFTSQFAAGIFLRSDKDITIWGIAGRMNF